MLDQLRRPKKPDDGHVGPGMLMPCLTPNRRSKGRHAYSLIAFTHRTSDPPVEHRGLTREPLPTLHGHIGHTRVQLDAVADLARNFGGDQRRARAHKRLVDRLAGAGVAAAGRKLGRLLNLALRWTFISKLQLGDGCGISSSVKP